MKSRKIFLLSQILFIVLVCILGIKFKPNFDIQQLTPTTKIIREQTTISKNKIIQIHDESLAFDGYTLVANAGDATTKLINMSGSVINEWKVDAERARLLPNGNLLVIHGSKWGKDKQPWKDLRDTIREYDWNGKIVWQHKAKDVAHHDLTRLANNNTVYLERALVPKELKKTINDPIKRHGEVRADSIVEINSNGETMWRWDIYDHFDLNSCGRRACRKYENKGDVQKKARDWSHVNTAQVIPENKWFDNGDTRFKPGNIVVLPRNWWTIYIIDKESGKPIWDFFGDYKGGISGGHEAHMIPKGLPGEGNILVLDNGSVVHKGESYILEINPVTKKLVWVYDAGTNFWTGSRGSVQRLPNGNTLISEDNTGRIFEVTQKSKKIVWEYKTDMQISRAKRYAKSYFTIDIS